MEGEAPQRRENQMEGEAPQRREGEDGAEAPRARRRRPGHARRGQADGPARGGGENQQPEEAAEYDPRRPSGVKNESGVPWIEMAHRLGCMTYFDENDPRAPNPPGFNGQLWPPQATLLHAMLALSERPVVRIADKSGAILRPHVYVLSEPPSSGKTVLALAFICANRVRLFPAPVNVLTMQTDDGGVAPINRAAVRVARRVGPRGPAHAHVLCPNGRGFLPELCCRYTRHLPLHIVVASNSVISQWEREARRFCPDLGFFTIDSVRTLKTFSELYAEGRLDAGLLFVKMGKVTTTFKMPGETLAPGAKQRSILRALRAVLDGVIVDAVIYDDADVALLTPEDCMLPAAISFVVSATRRQTVAKVHVQPAPTIEEFLVRNHDAFPVVASMLDDLLFSTLNLRCDPEYAKAYRDTPKIVNRRIIVEGGRAAEILRDLDVPAEVVEMLNGDAVETAASSLGIQAKSAAEVVRWVLADRLSRYQDAVARLARLDLFRKSTTGLPADRGNDKEYARQVRELLKNPGCTRAEILAFAAACKGYGPELRTILEKFEESALEARELHGKSLGRMRDNIREKQCQCCKVAFGGDGPSAEELEALAAFAPMLGAAAATAPAALDAYIVNCCQIVLCENCALPTNGAKRRFVKKCPNCARPVQPRGGLIRVGGGIDLEAALSDEALLGDEVEPADKTTEPPGVGAGPGEALGNKAEIPEPGGIGALDALAAEHAEALPKLRALVGVLRGEAPACIRDVRDAPPIVKGLLEGEKRIPPPANAARKVLVFAVHGESTRLISAALTHVGIRHVVLRGTRQQKDHTLEQFRGEVNVMVVTAARDCAGLDLPFVSIVVLYHHIRDENIRIQVVGRAQRVNRTHSLELVALLNQVEEAELAHRD